MDVNVDYENVTVTNQVIDSTSSSYIRYRPLMDALGEGKAVSIRINNGSIQPGAEYRTKYMSLEAIEIFWKDGGAR